LFDIFLHILAQVKTTQPRRYLVRPNQGIIQPNSTERVQIILVEKDKNTLYQSFLRLGQQSLDNCKDKFLVQSTIIRPTDNLSPTDYDGLTDFWSKLASNPNDPSMPPVHNKKLTVVHTGIAGDDKENSGSAAYAGGSMTRETELEALKKKYDELVAFSVNLTAERDVLNNTLEQTKRDLNRYMARGGGGGVVGDSGVGSYRSGTTSRSGGGFGLGSLLVVAVLAWLVGCYTQAQGKVDFLQTLPVLGPYFSGSAESTEPSTTTSSFTTPNEL
jgi:hypothetical protein